MKRNGFGDPVIQPGDDIQAIWNDHFMPAEDPELIARFVEKDENFGWSATLMDQNGMELEVHDFPSREALIEVLKDQQVEIEE